MSQLDEANIAATIVAIKAAAVLHQKLPPELQLVQHDEVLMAHTLRRLAIQHLEQAEAAKQKQGTITLRDPATRGGGHSTAPS